MANRRYLSPLPTALLGLSVLALAACDSSGNFDIDMRNFGRGGFDTTDAARNATLPRPATDDRGVISYPTYQVVVARRGDTVQTVADRIGLASAELATYNAISPGAVLREGEVLALPRRIEGGAVATGAGAAGGAIDVTTIASGAIDRADQGRTGGSPAIGSAAGTKSVTTSTIGQTEPIRHRVQRGETSYSIARLYGVDVKALGDWNGLGPDLAVREGQTLMVPIASAGAPRAVTTDIVTAPGQGSPTPTPPSATKPLPAEKTAPAAQAAKTPPAPDLGSQKTAASGSAKLAMPVSGSIIRAYEKKKNDGIDIAASAGTTVAAAATGTVAAITKDTEQVPILVLRHDGNLLTVYANIDGISVKKGDQVTRGQAIAKVRSSDPAFLHFEVRQGFDSVDPMPYLQ
jgi:murein DD-endopeptidase MepM/ murein hydrolase activator NlpD